MTTLRKYHGKKTTPFVFAFLPHIRQMIKVWKNDANAAHGFVGLFLVRQTVGK